MGIHDCIDFWKRCLTGTQYSVPVELTDVVSLILAEGRENRTQSRQVEPCDLLIKSLRK